MVNYYKILKVTPKASMAEIKSAYRRLARKLHPDASKSAKTSEDFAIVAKAYEILSNPHERAQYDVQLSRSNGSIHTTDSVFYSDNPHAQKLRQMAIERRYNEIVDRMINEERKETMALQQAIFPTVALFVSTFFFAIFKPLIWSNSEVIGKIVLLTLFAVSLLHIVRRYRSSFEHYTYDADDLHESIFEEVTDKPYSRFSAIAFLLIGIGISLGIGLFIGNYLEMFIVSMDPKLFSPTLQPEIAFYPPIVVLLVDVMHNLVSRFE